MRTAHGVPRYAPDCAYKRLGLGGMADILYHHELRHQAVAAESKDLVSRKDEYQ